MSDFEIFTSVTTNTTAFCVLMWCNHYKFTSISKKLLFPSWGWRQ